MKKILFALTLALGIPTLSSAQAIDAIEVTIYRQGQTTPAIAPMRWSINQWACGQVTTPPPTGTVANPTTVRIPDPADGTRDCVLVNPQVSAMLSQLGFDPVNTYVGRGRYVNLVGAGPESPNSNPFTQPGTTPTVAPAFLRLERGQ
jgi:hypothetical protein